MFGNRHGLIALVLSLVFTAGAAAQWQPQKAPLTTRWAKDVSPDNVLPEYPRPQMVREQWTNLNGLWDYAIVGQDAAKPGQWDGKILVPFAAESALSGVMKTVKPDQRLWYRRTFTMPRAALDGRRLLLHFGAVDWHATVYVNGKEVGQHKGGYDPFTIDITDALTPGNSGGEQELVVSVTDPTDTWTQARGKQTLDPKGIWYTAVTGIWQTVWLEPVPKAYVESLKIVPDIDLEQVTVTVNAEGVRPKHRVQVMITDPSMQGRSGDRRTVVVESSQVGKVGEPITLPFINQPKLWSPERPFLYDVQVSLIEGEGDGAATIDHVTSYLGMRKIALGTDHNGYTVLMLNDKPVFQWGPLDQGWWPAGLYTAPTDEALRYDLELTKAMGFNMVRKHVKTEPARWYYHCDYMGLLVWQDMPNGNLPEGQPNDLKIAATEEDANRPADSAKQFEHEWAELVKDFGHFPSIVMWVPFNEGWGQYETARITDYTRKLDPTRLVNSPSGWTDRGVGDVWDVHMYPGPGMEHASPQRAAVLGEYGGLGWPVQGHLWQDQKNWGYRTYQSREELNENYSRLMRSLYGLRGHGLAAAIYTQTTDVEIEVNGLVTYDREVIKFDPKEMTAMHARLFEPSPKAQVFAADSEDHGEQWRYTTEQPQGEWAAAVFDHSAWKTGEGAFGHRELPAATVRTQFQGKQLWLRRKFDVSQPTGEIYLRVFHQVGPAIVYLNGTEVARLEGVTRRHYGDINISEHAKLLKAGENVLAVHVTAPPREPAAFDAGLYGIAKRTAPATKRPAPAKKQPAKRQPAGVP